MSAAQQPSPSPRPQERERGRGTCVTWLLPGASKYLVRVDAEHLSPQPAVAVDPARAVAPFDRNERSERSRCFERRAEPRVIAQSAAEAGIVHRRVIEKPVNSDQPAGAPCEGGAKDRAAVVADERRWVPAQPVVERAERITAEPVEVVTAHPGPLDSGDQPGRE